MIFRRSPPPPVWQAQVDRAREAIRRLDPSLVPAVDRVESALAGFDAERERLVAALDHLDEGAARRDLTDELRRRPDPRAPDTELIETLRRRYDGIHQLRNRIEQLDERRVATLVDLDTLVTHAADRVASPFADGVLDADLERLRLDAETLDAARDELRHL